MASSGSGFGRGHLFQEPRELMTNLDDYRIREQPYYKPVGTEIALFEAADQAQ